MLKIDDRSWGIASPTIIHLFLGFSINLMSEKTHLRIFIQVKTNTGTNAALAFLSLIVKLWSV